METTTLNGEEYWKDEQGRLIPAENVPIIEKDRDLMVGIVVDEAKQLSKCISEFKEMAYKEANLYMDKLRKENRLPKRKGKSWRGNITFRDYGGLYKFVIAINDSIGFDENIKMAKEMIDKCMSKWAKGSDKNLVSIIFDAFDVDQKGKLRASKIMSLRKIKVDDKEWKKAMAMIDKSITVESTKRYIRVYEREGEGDEQQWRQVPLDLSSV